MKPTLTLKDIHVTIEDKEIIKGVSFDAHLGEIIAIMGPNGSGKSSLANGLMGHPSYSVTGQALLDGEDILALSADKRSKKGLFL